MYNIKFIITFILCLVCFISVAEIYGQSGDWKVWVKISPCSGRTDWISVSKVNPTISGLNYYYQADFVFPGESCTNYGCTFAAATAVASNLKTSDAFFDYCCREYSVWENPQTKARTVVLSNVSSPGPGWLMLNSDLCCEEAEDISGIIGACSGNGSNNEGNNDLTDKSWKVWVKTNPCSGRFDWISVAKDNPSTGGLGFYELANNIFPQTRCTSFGCTFEDATAVANTLKPSSKFFDYCCREYSVWENTITKARTVVLGKFGTPGTDWLIVKSNLCCEEAESLSGIPNSCSGNIDVHCYPGSYPAWNPQSQRTECFCNAGLVWNETKTACIKMIPDCPNIYTNSEAIWDATTNQYLCYCKQGYVWNNTKTACILAAPDCNAYYKNSIAVWNAASNQYLCDCPQGFVWNQARTECIINQIPDCNAYYKNSIAVWNAASNLYLCDCPQGFVWNQARTECISNQIPDCNSFYKNSYAAWDANSNNYLCYCNQGYEWNAQKTECIVSSGGNRDNPIVNVAQQKNGNCNIEYKSGANEPEQYTIDVKRNYGSVKFSYNTYTVKDRIHIYHGGYKIFDTGCIGSSGSQTLTLNGNSSVFTIIIDPLCDPKESDTSWDFTLGCPQ